MAQDHGFTLFETALGRCGVAWNDRGIAQVQLPERDDGATSKRITKRLPSARRETPPADVRAAIELIRAHLSGKTQDLGDISLDTSGLSAFDARVYRAARAVPAGRTVTYGELARQIGSAGAARAVGVALGRNPFAIVVPCHRVVAANGRPGGFSAHGGLATKAMILAKEGVRLDATPR